MAQAKEPMLAHRGGRPWRLPSGDWKTVFVNSWREQSDDNIGLVAAGVAFYGFLALVPLLGAVVLSYGLVASPNTVIQNVRHLAEVMPASAAKLIGQQLLHVVDTSGGKKGIGLVLALGIALFGARNAAGALITALNIAFEEKETRGFVRLNLFELGMTAAFVLFAILAALAVAVIGYVEDLIPFASGFLSIIGKALTYALLAAAGAAVAATLYRFGPARQQAGWEWLTPGSILAAAGWVLLTLGFGIYVAHFGHYNATYGSLGAVIVLLTWLYLSSYIFLFGAELNSEVEKLLQPEKQPSRAEPAPPPSPQRRSPPADLSVAPSAAPQVLAVDCLAAEAGVHLSPLFGGRTVGTATTLLGAIGLGLLRRRERAAHGAILLGVAAAVAVASGRRVRTKPPSTPRH